MNARPRIIFLYVLIFQWFHPGTIFAGSDVPPIYSGWAGNLFGVLAAVASLALGGALVVRLVRHLTPGPYAEDDAPRWLDLLRELGWFLPPLLVLVALAYPIWQGWF